jgi:excisionase family DNA binding protein
MHHMQDTQELGGRGSGTLLTTRDVQALINVDRSTIYRMAEDGRLPAVKVGRQWRFPADRIYAWLDTGDTSTQGVAPPPGPAPGAALQTLADVMGAAFGAMVVITDMNGEPLTGVANPCGMFAAVQSRPETLDRCIEGWKEFSDQPDLVPRFTRSHLGFLCARGFIRRGRELTGMVIVGGIAPPEWPPPSEFVAEVADELGIPAQAIGAHIDEVYHLDGRDMDRILDLLPRVGVLISQMSTNAAPAPERTDSLPGRHPQRREP